MIFRTQIPPFDRYFLGGEVIGMVKSSDDMMSDLFESNKWLTSFCQLTFPHQRASDGVL